MMMMYHYYRLIRLLELLPSIIRKLIKPLPYCERCGLRYCDGSRCGFPPAPRWAWPRSTSVQQSGWVREGNVWTNMNPQTPKPNVPPPSQSTPKITIKVESVRGTNVPTTHDPEKLRRAMDQLAEKHARWIREQFAQLDIEKAERAMRDGAAAGAAFADRLLDEQIAPALREVCEKEAARL